MNQRNIIEIPFGAKDSELVDFEYTIPEGYEAEIKDGKILVRKTKSENEKIRKELLLDIPKVFPHDKAFRYIAWLEKQKPLENYDESEKEKADFVGDGFIQCHADFLDFKEGNTYLLEYIGDDKYSVRSDNLLGKTYHITPCQLYTIFKKLTWLEKQGGEHPKFKKGDTIKKKSTGDVVTISEIDLKNREYRLSNNGFIPFKYEHLWELVEQKPANWLQELEDKLANATPQQLAEWKEKYFKEKPAEWGDKDDGMLQTVINRLELSKNEIASEIPYVKKCVDWLKSLKEKVGNFDDGYKVGFSAAKHNQWKPTKEQLEAFASALSSYDAHCGSDPLYYVVAELYEQLKAL